MVEAPEITKQPMMKTDIKSSFDVNHYCEHFPQNSKLHLLLTFIRENENIFGVITDAHLRVGSIRVKFKNNKTEQYTQSKMTKTGLAPNKGMAKVRKIQSC